MAAYPPLTPRETLKVAAVVVTYDRPVELRHVIEALLAQTFSVTEILVFDNGGRTPALEVLKGLQGPITIVRSDQNLGGSGGFSEGLRQVLKGDADWIFLLDDDAIPAPDAVETLLAVLPSLPSDVGVLCSKVLEDNDLALWHRRKFQRLLGLETPLSRKAYESEAIEMDTASFVGFLLKREAALEIGLPRADFFLSYDDTEYSLRLQDAGWRLWLVPSSKIIHLRTSQSRLRSSPFGNKHALNIRNQWVVRRHYARWPHLAGLQVIAYGFLLWCVAGGFRSREQARLLLSAFRDGMAGRLGPPQNPSQRKELEPKIPDLTQAFLEKTFPEELKIGVVIMRTQGHRPTLMMEAIRSVQAQRIPMKLFLVVHGSREDFDEVSKLVKGIDLDLTLLHAEAELRQRGYPINVALKAMYDSEETHDFVAFLDDDDLLYPEFAGEISKALKLSGADVVYGGSDQWLPEGRPESAYRPLPIACLLVENFIPINAYGVRFDALLQQPLFFDEHLEVLEDWQFLHQLMSRGFHFAPSEKILSAFRIIGDGNTPQKKDQALWDRAWDQVHAGLDSLWPKMSEAALIESLMNFDYSKRVALSKKEEELVRLTESALINRYGWPISKIPNPSDASSSEGGPMPQATCLEGLEENDHFKSSRKPQSSVNADR